LALRVWIVLSLTVRVMSRLAIRLLALITVSVLLRWAAVLLLALIALVRAVTTIIAAAGHDCSMNGIDEVLEKVVAEGKS
jgi:hypothetical protein